MAEQALYRKYRSNTFDEVVGQDHVVRTLVTAVAKGRFSHAYLFTGPRGVGKTSVARLLARALNCTGDPKPCNQCPSCLAAINSSLDVIEIDAASNRSIDSVRDLREKIGLAPSGSKYKIYIIDEVHMLTTEAFNALLKTLEEPPSHAVFVLATTEAHKVPETIISRTQRFNFKPIAASDLTKHLSEIAAKEGINVTPEAVEIIAAASRGGFRDAISLLDQLSASPDEITGTRVRDLLGFTSSEEILTLSRALATNDPKTAIETTQRLSVAGAQPAQVVVQLIEFWRNVLLTVTGAHPSPDTTVRDIAMAVSAARAAMVIEELLPLQRSPWPGLALEATLVKLTAQPQTPPQRRVAASAPVTTKAAAVSVAEPVPQAQSQPIQPAAQSANPEAAPDGSLWPKVLVLVKAQNNSLCALMQMYPVDFAPDQIVIKPRFNFHRDILLKPTNRSIIEASVAKVYGRRIKVQALTEETPAKPKPRKPDTSEELVASALEILGGEIVD